MTNSNTLQQICQDSFYPFSEYIIVKECNKDIAIPICSEHQESCRYAGQRVQGTHICDAVLRYDRRIKELTEGEDFVMRSQ